MKDPYAIIIKRRFSEKSKLMEELQRMQGKPSLTKCKLPKYVFEVATCANKSDIKDAVEEIYKEQNIKVLRVNTVQVKGKVKRRGRGRLGRTVQRKKAVVTLAEGNALADNV